MRRKWLKWVVWILLTPIILFVILMVLLYIPPVQNLIRKQATAIASEATGMDISVERIDLRFPLNGNFVMNFVILYAEPVALAVRDTANNTY